MRFDEPVRKMMESRVPDNTGALWYVASPVRRLPFTGFRARAPRRVGRVVSVAAVVALAALGAGCASSGPGVATMASALGLPAWDGTDRELFGDEIDPSAVGFVPPKDPKKDPKLAARALRAELVGKIRVQTFTVETRGGDAHYVLSVRFADPPVVATQLAEREFEVSIEPGDAAYGLMKTLDAGIKGRSFIGLVKRFRSVDDEIEPHFYLAPDTEDVVGAIQEAIAVKEVWAR